MRSSIWPDLAQFKEIFGAFFCFFKVYVHKKMKKVDHHKEKIDHLELDLAQFEAFSHQRVQLFPNRLKKSTFGGGRGDNRYYRGVLRTEWRS